MKLSSKWVFDANGRFATATSTLLGVEEATRAKAIQLRAALSTGPKSLPAGIAGSLVLGIVCGQLLGAWDDTKSLALIWLVATAGGFTVSLFHALTFVGKDISDRELFKHEKFALASTAATSLACGSSALFFLPASSPHLEAFLIIGIALMLIGGAGSLAVYRPMLIAYVIPLVVVFSGSLALWGDVFHLSAAGGFLLLGFVILSFARNQESAIRSTILLGFEKERLIKALSEQTEAAESARVQAEQSRARAELADQGKTTFLTAAGHDLRQPMHALVQYFGHLQRINRDPQLDETVARIGKSIDAMQDLLDSIVEVSRLMMGAVKPVHKIVELREIVDSVDAQVRPLAENKGLSFYVDSPSCLLSTDEVLLQRIIRNLAVNAVRYTEAGSVRISAKRRRGLLTIRVIDSGIGIGREDRKKIFEPFFQVGNDARHRKKGLGLGLAIVEQLGQLLGARISVRSRVGLGSIFRVNLPAPDELSLPMNIHEHAQHADFVHGSKVMLIDDNESSLEATAATLRMFGCQVLTVTSSLAAIEALQNQEFALDLVISDYRLVGETGIDAVKLVLENQRALYGEDFLVASMIISGDTAPAELAKIRRENLELLHKPVAVDDLYRAVNKQLAMLAGVASL